MDAGQGSIVDDEVSPEGEHREGHREPVMHARDRRADQQVKASGDTDVEPETMPRIDVRHMVSRIRDQQADQSDQYT